MLDKINNAVSVNSNRLINQLIETFVSTKVDKYSLTGADKKEVQLSLQVAKYRNDDGEEKGLDFNNLLVDPRSTPEMVAIIEECYEYARSGASKLSHTTKGKIWLMRAAPLDDEPLTFNQIAIRLRMPIKEVIRLYEQQELILQRTRIV